MLTFLHLFLPLLVLGWVLIVGWLIENIPTNRD